MRPSRGPWNQKIFSEFSTEVIVLYVFFAGEWKSVIKIKSCTDSSEAVLIYFKAIHTNHYRRKFLQNDRFAGSLLQLRAVNHFGELLILLGERILRKEQRRIWVAFRQLRITKHSKTHIILRVVVHVDHELRVFEGFDQCRIAASERLRYPSSTFAHRTEFCLYSCIESASPVCHTRENGPATESSGDRNRRKASSSTSHRFSSTTFRYRCINVIANARVCARSSSSSTLFPSIDRCFSVWLSPIRIYVYLLAIASKPKRFPVKPKRMRCVESDRPCAFDVPRLNNTTFPQRYFH